jgi:glycosyltransferase involved in cell wall biosynthesis
VYPAPHLSRLRSDRGRLAVSVVVPLFNEQENIAGLWQRLQLSLESTGLDYEILVVDDGSRDATPDLLDALHDQNEQAVVVRLSRNFGHQAAVCAGLEHARGRAVVVMDGDLQDPPELIPELIRLWREGHDVVYAVRRRRSEGLFKRLSYRAFYRLLSSISELEIPLDSGDFCLMDRRVVDTLNRLPEKCRFVRGLRSFLGFRQVGLEYDRPAREAGRPKYTFRKLSGLAVEGLVSFSAYPLRLVTYLGLATAVAAVALTVWALNDAIRHQTAPRGWASTLVVVLFMGAIQLLSLGIIGEYIRLIFLETKNRPTYIVAELKRHDTDAQGDERFPAPLDRLSRADHYTPPSWDDP